MNKEIVEAQKNIGQFLKRNETKIISALPCHLNKDRMLSIVMTEIRRVPKLAECSLASIFSAVLQISQLGLEPGSVLGHAYLIPYNKTCQFIVGYKGMIDLARRSGQIKSISAQVVYENDKFFFSYGLNEELRHVPSLKERGRIVAAYAYAKLVDGGYQYDVMSKEQIDQIKSRSKSGNSGPWVTDYEEMARKTVIRRLFKYLPISIEPQKAVSLDEQAERGEQDNSHIIDVDIASKTKSEELLEKIGD